MARRNDSLFDTMLEIASMLPWQAGLLIAVGSYFGFHYMAASPPEILAASGAKDLANNVGKQMLMGVSSILQFVIPFIFTLGAGFSFFRKRRQAKLHAEVGAGGDRSALEGISWQDFEILTAEVFRRKGYQVEHRGGNTADGGIDLQMRMGRDKYLVQCKQWKSTKVGVNVVRELFGVMSAEGAVGGFVVASGEFTKDAEKFAQGRSIELVSTDLMLRLIQQTLDDGGPAAQSSGTPLCPACGAAMVLRSATKGTMAGSQFWGCSRYPSCKGTRNLLD